MERRTIASIHWWANLLLIAACCHFIRIYPTTLIRELGLGTLVAIIASVLVLVRWRKRWRLSCEPAVAFSSLTLILIGLTIAVGAVHDLPVIVNQRSVYAIHLGPFYRVIHYVFTIYATAWTLISGRRSAKAEMGLVAIVVYTPLNGGLFHIVGDQFALLFGLSLVTALIHLTERTGEDACDVSSGQVERGPPSKRRLPPLGLPVLMFLLAGGLATVTSLYIHNSLNYWLRLGNWVLVYFLIVSIVREKEQLERLTLVMLSIAVVTAGAGLVGVAGYASRMGWSNALQARLWIADKPHNGVATFLVTYITLSSGLLLVWSSRWRRALLSAAIGLLLVCASLTYSRTAGMGLLCGLVVLALFNKPTRAFLWNSSRSFSVYRRKWWVWSLALVVPLLLVAATLLIRLEQETLTTRLYIWRAVLNVIRHRPLLGVGLNNHFVPAFSDVLSYRELEAIERIVHTHSHNLLMEIGEGMGLVGVGLFLWLLVAAARYSVLAIRSAADTPKRGFLLALCAANVALLIPHILALSLSVATLLPVSLWILLGLIVAVSKIEFQEGEVATTEKPEPKPPEPLDRLGRARCRQDSLLANLILVGVLLGVVRPLVARVAQRQGTMAWSQGDRFKAASALNLAAWLQPLDAELQATLGDVVRGDEVVAAYRRASALRPYYAPYHTQLGWLHWAYNRIGEALAEFERAVALDWYGLDGGEHHSDLGLAYAAAGMSDLALAAFQEAAVLDPASISGPDWRRVGSGVALDGSYTRYQETRRVDDELSKRIAFHLGRSGVDPTTFGPAGKPQIYLGDLVDGLLVEAEQTAASDQEWATEALSNLAELCLRWTRDHRLARTLDVFEKLALGTEAEAEFHRWQGIFYQRQGKLQEAQAEFQAAFSIVDRPHYHHLLGTTYIQQGLLQEGIAELERAAGFWDPKVIRLAWWPIYWEDLARAYRYAGRPDDAIAAYKMAQFFTFSVHPYLRIQLVIGEIHREQGVYAREIGAYVHALEILSARGKLDPQDQDLLRQLARHAVVSYKQQQLTAEEAWAAHERLIEADDDVSEAYLKFFQQEVEKRLPQTTD